MTSSCRGISCPLWSVALGDWTMERTSWIFAQVDKHKTKMDFPLNSHLWAVLDTRVAVRAQTLVFVCEDKQTLRLENLNDGNNAWNHPIIAMAPMVSFRTSNIYVKFFFWLKMDELVQLRSLPRCNNSGLEVRGVNLVFLPIVAAAAPIQTSSVSPSLAG